MPTSSRPNWLCRCGIHLSRDRGALFRTNGQLRAHRTEEGRPVVTRRLPASLTLSDASRRRGLLPVEIESGRIPHPFGDSDVQFLSLG